MITRTKALPPQYGYIHLTKGIFLRTDPLWFLRGTQARRWDNVWRVKWKVPSFFYGIEVRRHMDHKELWRYSPKAQERLAQPWWKAWS